MRVSKFKAMKSMSQISHSIFAMSVRELLATTAGLLLNSVNDARGHCRTDQRGFAHPTATAVTTAKSTNTGKTLQEFSVALFAQRWAGYGANGKSNKARIGIKIP